MARQKDVPLPYGYMLFILTKEETIKGGNYLGFNYAYQNKDRWINIDSTGYELQTYDRGFTHIVYQDKVYDLFCDYLLIEEQTRLFVARFYDSDIHEIKPLEDDKYQKKNSDGKKVTVRVHDNLRDLETARIIKEEQEKKENNKTE